MPKPESFSLPTVTGTGNGDKRDIFRYRDKVVHFVYTGGTHHLEVSLDATNWFQVGANVTATAVIPIPDTWNWARVRTSVAGTVVALFGGQDFQAG